MSDDWPHPEHDGLANFERAYGEFVGHPHPAGETSEGFGDWVRNLHDVYLNVEVASLASLFVPPSDVEQRLEELGGSRRQRLGRFLARDVWVLWEAWDRRPQFHEFFAKRSPLAFDRLRELEEHGKSLGWFKRIRQVRDYMNHRDQRVYNDAGRRALPEDCVEWMNNLRTTFSDILLAAMGIPVPRSHLALDDLAMVRNSTNRDIAIEAVGDLLIGAVAAMELGRKGASETTAIAAGHFGRAFTAVACANPPLWGECLTALTRRSVVAWLRMSVVPELREFVGSIELDAHSLAFFTAVSTDLTDLTDDSDASPPERSRLAVHRVVAWFNGNGDLVRTLSGAVSVTTILVSTVVSLEEKEADVAAIVGQLGVEADGLLAQ